MPATQDSSEDSTTLQRSSGILLHPTSLASEQSLGSLGAEATEFARFLQRAEVEWWQVLPAHPPGPGNSPYMASSARAGDVGLVDLAELIECGWLPADALRAGADQDDLYHRRQARIATVERAAEAGRLAPEFQQFRHQEAGWLDDYTLFEALSRQHDGRPWSEWSAELRDRRPEALDHARHELSEATERIAFGQFCFFSQWRSLRSRTNELGVRLLGDIPIFVAHNSADVWAHPELFTLDAEGESEQVAGVPPDYFSETGQLWGNPLFRWERHAESGYAWWLDRIRGCLDLVDRLRLDHFRGFEAYWEIPAGDETAINGRWVPGPGAEFFRAVRSALGELPLLAEDLGVITPPVEALRDNFGLPGMSVLQFAFGGDAENAYLPHNYDGRPLVAYTGTHDNDTTRGWYEALEPAAAHHVRMYLQVSGDDIAWDLIRSAWASSATLAIAPLQDLLSLPTEARMNTPGSTEGNWEWRMPPGALTEALAERMRALNALYNRSGRRRRQSSSER